MKIDPNSPAFPQSVNVSTQHGHYTSVMTHPGLPIRLHLAAMAMQGMCRVISDSGAEPHYGTVAIRSLAMADELIKKYNRTEEKP
jgi:hypothetical protein